MSMSTARAGFSEQTAFGNSVTVNLIDETPGDSTFGQVVGTAMTGPTGHFTVNLTNINAFGGDIHVRVYVLTATGTLRQTASSTTLGGVAAQTAVAGVAANQRIYVWVFGYDFAVGSYDMAITLS